MLLLDEPSTGLDPRQRERLWEFVLALAGGGTTVIFSTHYLLEAERYGDRLLVLADGERVFDGTPSELHAAVPSRAPATSRRRSSPSSASGATEAAPMRWLLLKDLQILRRSPLVVGLLVAYPIVIGVLIGFALSGEDGKPRVAFFNQVAEATSVSDRRRRGGARPRRSPATSCARGSSAWTSTRARRPSRRSRTATCSGR